MSPQEIAEKIAPSLLGAYDGFDIDTVNPALEPGSVLVEGVTDAGDPLSFTLQVVDVDIEPAVAG